MKKTSDRKKEIKNICKELEKQWLKNPEQRLGQFICNVAFQLETEGGAFYTTDNEMRKALLNYINIPTICDDNNSIILSIREKPKKQVNIKIHEVKNLEFESFNENEDEKENIINKKEKDSNKYYQCIIDWSKIKTNKILRCKKCKILIQSHYRHDFVFCKCGSIFVDGGSDYVRYGGKEEDIEFINSKENLLK